MATNIEFLQIEELESHLYRTFEKCWVQMLRDIAEKEIGYLLKIPKYFQKLHPRLIKTMKTAIACDANPGSYFYNSTMTCGEIRRIIGEGLVDVTH